MQAPCKNESCFPHSACVEHLLCSCRELRITECASIHRNMAWDATLLGCKVTHSRILAPPTSTGCLAHRNTLPQKSPCAGWTQQGQLPGGSLWHNCVNAAAYVNTVRLALAHTYTTALSWDKWLALAKGGIGLPCKYFTIHIHAHKQSLANRRQQWSYYCHQPSLSSPLCYLHPLALPNPTANDKQDLRIAHLIFCYLSLPSAFWAAPARFP